MDKLRAIKTTAELWIHTQIQNMLDAPQDYAIKLLTICCVITAVCLLLKSAALTHEKIKNLRIERAGALLEVLVKETVPAKNTEALIRNLHSLLLNTKMREFLHGRPYISFEIAAKKDGITFYIWAPKNYVKVLSERIYATYPECSIREASEYLTELHEKQSVYVTEMELAFHHVLSLSKDLDKEDILGSIVSSMKDLEWHEQVVMQVLARPVDGSWQRNGEQVIKDYITDGRRPRRRGASKQFWSKQLADAGNAISRELNLNDKTRNSVANRKTPYERTEISSASKKIVDAGFETVIRLAAIGNYRTAAKTQLKILGAAFNELDKENKLSRKIIHRRGYYYKLLRKRRIYLSDRSNILSPGELSKFFIRLPGEELLDVYSEIQSLVVKEFAPPKGMEQDKFRIGKNIYRGVETYVGLKPRDIVRHMIVQGKTGTGKSEWAKGLMMEVMTAGLGFALFEPHGKLAVETLQFIPENRHKDVIVFDLFDDYPPAFNFCKVKPIPGRKIEESVEKTAKEIIDINRRLFSEAWSGKNAYYLENAIKTVIELKGGNYVDIRRLFSDAEFRAYAIDNIKDPQLKHFWREEFKLDKKGNIPAGTQSTVNSVDYKLGTFLNSKSLLRSVGQDDCIDFKEILDNNKILIFRFDKERMSEDQIAFIGGIAIKLLIVEVFRRDRARWDDPYLVIIDEAQNFIDPSLKTVLYELRKYGLGLVMMHQALEQMNYIKGLTDAIYGSVGTMVSFTAGKPDAPFFEKLFEPRIDEADMTRLPSRYGYCKLMVDGQTSEAFNIYTLDSPQVERDEDIKNYKRIVEANREGRLHYTEVDKAIVGRLAGGASDVDSDREKEYIPDDSFEASDVWEDWETDGDTTASWFDDFEE